MWLQGRVGARSLINYDEDERKEQATVIKGGAMSALRRVQAQIYITLHGSNKAGITFNCCEKRWTGGKWPTFLVLVSSSFSWSWHFETIKCSCLEKSGQQAGCWRSHGAHFRSDSDCPLSPHSSDSGWEETSWQRTTTPLSSNLVCFISWTKFFSKTLIIK